MRGANSNLRVEWLGQADRSRFVSAFCCIFNRLPCLQSRSSYWSIRGTDVDLRSL